jgi:WD40 repeat protein
VDDANVVLWDVATGKPREVLRGHTGGVYAVVVGKDGRELYTAAADGTVRVWSLADW